MASSYSPSLTYLFAINFTELISVLEEHDVEHNIPHNEAIRMEIFFKHIKFCAIIETLSLYKDTNNLHYFSKVQIKKVWKDYVHHL